MSLKIGRLGKVALGSDTISKMMNWSLDGVQIDQIDTTAFGDDWKQHLYGLKDGGTVSFSGHFDPDDNTGVQKLIEANAFASALTNLRLYLDNTSYFEPCQSSGYLSPDQTTGAPTQLSTVTVTNIKTSLDASGVGKIEFQAKVSGCMVLV